MIRNVDSSKEKGSLAPTFDTSPPQRDEMFATEKTCFTVGIGVSAGGQGALEHLFTVMPPDCDTSFVVVMHLPTEGPSFLADMLRRYTAMEVVTAEEAMPLLPNRVHVIPAGRELTVSAGRVRLQERGGERGLWHPVDSLFRSLATDIGGQTIVVVLSGSGTDGADGVKEVREVGGIVIVQDPGSAIETGMPLSAVATGVADFILQPEEIPMKIAEIARGSCSLAPQRCRTTTIDEELAAIFSIVKARTGHDFSSYKTSTVMRRIERRMAVCNAGGIRKYVTILEENPQEAQALCQDILIGVTSFFRDPEAFVALRREVIPRLFADRGPDEPVRIWHACCATGEEVYSTTILMREYLNEHKLDARVQFFATDIDEAAISQARAGLYGGEIATDVGEERLKTFFTKYDGRWQVTKQLREMVVFAAHNLLKNPPFSRLDLLVCRNFLIYLNPDMQKRIFALFHQVLKPGGFLFLGNSESVGRQSDLFTPVDKKWKIFERLETGRRGVTSFPFTTPVRISPATARLPRQSEPLEPAPGAVAEKLLMKRYFPPSVVVNEKYEVVHISTRSNRFLEIPSGEPTRDLLLMAREELRPLLRAAIYKAFAEQREVAFRGVKVNVADGETTVNVLVEPLKTHPFGGRLAVVVFEPALQPMIQAASFGEEEPLAGDDTSKSMLIRQFEEQLRITHEQLQAVSEQLETSNEGFLSANEELISLNEESQSANEELQSTNEELETSKEELQALNEELVTVNAELQGKVEELNQSNSDMENLLESSEIATLFLDRRLHIKRFTPAAAAIFNLIPADVGRPFRHLAGTIDWPGLSHDAEEVLEKLVPVEREVAAVGDGRCFLMRVLPYRITERRIDGIIVTLIDITERKRMEEALREHAQLLDLTQVLVRDLESRIVLWTLGAQNLYGFTRGEALRRVSHELFQTEFPEPLERIVEKLHRDGAWEGELVQRGRDGRKIVVASQWVLNYDSQGKPMRILEYDVDVTGRKQAEEELHHAKEAAEAATKAKSQFLANMSHELRTPMTGVLGMLDLAIGGPLETEQRECIETARTSGRSLLRILNDILDLTKVEAGILSMEEKPFALRDCVAGAVDILIPEARRKGIELIRPAADDLTQTVVGDQLRLRQVLTNLIGNAVKFTEEGKVEIRVAAGEKTAAGKREFIFTVADTGIGIPADKKHLIFRSFSQVDDSDTRGYGGVGLGLAISREIVERMGGKISFVSEERVGSTFTFTVPLGEGGIESEAAPETWTEEPAASAAPLPGTGVKPRLLIAEDDPITRKIIGMMLQRSNYDLDVTEDGLAAVGMWEKGAYDLILMDVQMPRMDGFEAARAIRERERERGGHIPIVALTAHALKEDEEKCLAAGMDSYISKPIDFMKCLQVIGELLKK
jgi:PAS domain S-box-containing protein